MLTRLATGLTLARLAWAGGWGGTGGGGDWDWGSDLSRRALCAAARLCHRCRNVGGSLSLGGGISEADFLLRWQDDEEEVKNRMSGWI